MENGDFRAKISEIKHSSHEIMVSYFGRNYRRPKKDRDDDRRRKYSFQDDIDWLRRYEQLGRNQSALARELGVSQPAVWKRLKRARKEQAETARKTLAMLQFIFEGKF